MVVGGWESITSRLMKSSKLMENEEDSIVEDEPKIRAENSRTTQEEVKD